MAQITRSEYQAVVIGAGPAGIATIGNLLDHGIKPIQWIDPKFEGGRLNAQYREVSSNTKAKLFVDFVDACDSLKKAVCASSKQGPYEKLKSQPQDKGCALGFAADVCLQVTDGLKQMAEIDMVEAYAETLQCSKDGSWNVISRTAGNSERSSRSRCVVLCTGSFPTPPTLPTTFTNLRAVDLDTALSPPRLSSLMPRDEACNIAIIGASHSAILVLRNLYNLAATSHPQLRMTWFSRHPLRYAEERDGWILRDNTGPKGEAAVWARENLEPAVFDGSDLSRFMSCMNTANNLEKLMYSRVLPRCTHSVEAIGFTRSALPKLMIERDNEWMEESMYCDHETGGFLDSKRNRIRGLYGIGIAFPARVVDCDGNEEMAVGMWKFMKYLKKIVPAWKTEILMQ